MTSEEKSRHKAPNRYSHAEDDDELVDVGYDEHSNSKYNKSALLKFEVENAIKGPQDPSYQTYTQGISNQLDDEKRHIDVKMTRQIIEDSYKLPTEHIMKYSTLDQKAKEVILDDLTAYYEEENKELYEI